MIAIAIVCIADQSPKAEIISPKAEISYPEPIGYVVDTANVLSAETEATLTQILTELDSTAQVAVVTVETTQPQDEKQYAIELAERWKPGYEGKDNGVIFLIVTKDRKVRIEVGKGLESVLNDSKAGRILDDSVVPHLKNNDWDNGALSGVEAIKREVTK